jgi:hypothetical protein
LPIITEFAFNDVAPVPPLATEIEPEILSEVIELLEILSEVIALSAILLVVIVPSPTKEPEMPLEIFAEKIVAPVFARNEILLSESVLIDDTTICPAIMTP